MGKDKLFTTGIPSDAPIYRQAAKETNYFSDLIFH
jgi:hypothetical protein